MKPDDALLKILACPIDKGPLVLLASEEALYNPRLRRRYPILDGIPQLLPSSGEQVSEDEHERAIRESKDRNEIEGELADEIEEVGTTESGTEAGAGTGTGRAPGGAAGGAAGVTEPGPERVASGWGPGAGAGS
ncbi:hypothetical protein SNOUR_28115 [Streptomyces noursei ATCC 11455]|nr:hypothetical protein SNOUR_28115 [Streptomyces noursei ATCC 11455]